MQVRDLPAELQGFAGTWVQLFDGCLERSKTDGDPARRQVFADQAQVIAYTLQALGLDAPAPGQRPPLVLGENAPPPVRLGVQSKEAVNPPPPPPPSQQPVLSIDLFSRERVDGPLSQDAGRRMAIAVARQLQVDLQLTPEQAAGIVGNLWHESAGMNSNVNEFGSDPSKPTYGPPNGTLFGYGWAQWTGERKTAYLAYCQANGLEASSPAANYAFLKHELLTSEAVSLGKVREAGTVDEAARAYMLYNERPTMPVYDKRVAAAEVLYRLIT
jgi:hypothetical protein